MGEGEVYIGTKIVKAQPMDEVEFLRIHRGISENPNNPRPGYMVRYEDGYTSWSPKEVFERAYRLITSAEKAMI